MLNDFEKAVLKSNQIDEDLVEGVTTSYEVTFKDGTKQQLCEVYSRVMGL